MPLTDAKPSTPPFKGRFEGFILLPCFAIACFRMFANVAPSAGDLDVLLFCVQALALLILVVVERFVSYGKQALTRLVAAACVVMAVGGVVSFGARGPAEVVGGGVLRNVGSAALIFALGHYLCSIKPAFALLTIVTGFALNGALALSTPLVSPGSLELLPVVFALGAGVCLAWGIDKATLCAGAGEVSWRELPRLPWLWLLLPVVFLNVVLEMTTSGVRIHESSNYIWLAIYLVDFLVTFVWVCLLGRDDVERLLPVFIATLFVGPLFFLSFQSFAQEFSAGVAIAIRRTNMLVVWAYLVMAARRVSLPAPTVFGLGHLLCLQLPRILGKLLGPVLAGAGEGAASLVGAVAVFATILVVACCGLRRYLGSGKEGARRPAWSAASPQGSPVGLTPEGEPLLEALGLTRREAEVAGFLRSAYTLPQIAERLNISHETVRTHVKNIYAKAGVRSRQEFLLLLEAGGAGMASR